MSAGNKITNDGTNSYIYDAQGQLTEKTQGPNSTTWFYTYNNLGQMTSAAEYTAASGGTLIASASYVYDVFGGLIKETSGATTTITAYRISDIAHGITRGVNEAYADLNGSLSLLYRYVSDGLSTTPIARLNASALNWIWVDRQNSVILISDNSGNVLKSVFYDGFGNITSTTGTGDLGAILYAGYRIDSVTGFGYAHYRWLNFATGQWTSIDPIGFAAGDANLNRYVKNNTTNAYDPSGLDKWYYDPSDKNADSNIRDPNQIAKVQQVIQANLDRIRAAAMAAKAESDRRWNAPNPGYDRGPTWWQKQQEQDKARAKIWDPIFKPVVKAGAGMLGGATGGAASGGTVGAVVGSIVPGPGTLAGAGAGALAGAISGGITGLIGSFFADDPREAAKDGVIGGVLVGPLGVANKGRAAAILATRASLAATGARMEIVLNRIAALQAARAIPPGGPAPNVLADLELKALQQELSALRREAQRLDWFLAGLLAGG